MSGLPRFRGPGPRRPVFPIGPRRAAALCGTPLGRLGAALLIVLLAASLAGAQERKPARPSPGDKCPVCGMFVAKYPDWTAQAVFADGSRVYFDGAKDLFKYLLNLKKYSPSRKPADLAGVYVTDYYEVAFIDGRLAFYVLGSDVLGPMGRELIPLRTEAAARDFMRDHQGKSLVRFNQVTAETLKGLD